MKLKELVNLLKETNFTTSAIVFEGSKIIEHKVVESTLASFGLSSWSAYGAKRKEDVINIEFNGKILSFDQYSSITPELMECEVIKIKKIVFNPYINKSSSGNYYSDFYSCAIDITVK